MITVTENNKLISKTFHSTDYITTILYVLLNSDIRHMSRSTDYSPNKGPKTLHFNIIFSQCAIIIAIASLFANVVYLLELGHLVGLLDLLALCDRTLAVRLRLCA